MRFLLIIKSDAKAEAGVMPDEQLLSAMGNYNESLVKAGVLLAGEGRKPSSLGARVHIAKGKATVKDGPFAEAKEVLGGYWMIQVKSREEAIEWATRCPGGENEIIEIRQVQELAEFPADVQAVAGKYPEMQPRLRDAS